MNILTPLRVVSMVPSWTETLLEAKVSVVGRTRFCIHPADLIRSIPAVGGTKDWNWEKILELKPDLLILDKEENPLIMAQQQEIPFIATHVTSVYDMPKQLLYLSQHLKNLRLEELSQEWEVLLSGPQQNQNGIDLKIPALIKWGKRPEAPIKKIIYVIWKNPWMTVSADTFIGSVLSYVGLKVFLPIYAEKYPKIALDEIAEKQSTLILFSSEPYPFMKNAVGLAELNIPYAFVDGESLSWFGVRSLRFLQNQLFTIKE